MSAVSRQLRLLGGGGDLKAGVGCISLRRGVRKRGGGADRLGYWVFLGGGQEANAAESIEVAEGATMREKRCKKYIHIHEGGTRQRTLRNLLRSRKERPRQRRGITDREIDIWLEMKAATEGEGQKRRFQALHE